MIEHPGARFVVLRHAESEGNARGVIQGSGEYPLTGAGVDAALRAASVVRSLNPAHIVSSDLSRAADTARALMGRVDALDARLRERGAGSWEGRLRSELEAVHPGALESDDLRPDDYESDESVLRRCAGALKQAGETVVSGLILVVCHGAVMRVLDRAGGGSGARFAHLCGLALDADLRVLGRISLVGGESS
jgi:broad specificity phosphatase PhoE